MPMGTRTWQFGMLALAAGGVAGVAWFRRGAHEDFPPAKIGPLAVRRERAEVPSGPHDVLPVAPPVPASAPRQKVSPTRNDLPVRPAPSKEEMACMMSVLESHLAAKDYAAVEKDLKALRQAGSQALPLLFERLSVVQAPCTRAAPVSRSHADIG